MFVQRAGHLLAAVVLCGASAFSACAPSPAPPDPSDGGVATTDAGAPHAPLGPRIQVVPSPAVHFGEVAFFEGGVQALTVRKLAILNVGDAPLTLDSIELRTLTASAPSGELQLRAPEGWQPGDAVEARAGSNVIELELRLTPKALGARAWRLTVASNDALRPNVELDVSANVVTAPPCQLSIPPAIFAVQGGVAQNAQEVGVPVTNTGTNSVQQCLISGVALNAPTGSPLSLGAWTPGPTVVRAGETVHVPVRVESLPSGAPPRTSNAELQLQVANPARTITVPVRVDQQAPGCLTLAPDELDFGAGAQTCEGPAKTINIYNTCAVELSIKSFSLVGPTVPSEVGSCTGPQPCPEFELFAAPSIPPGGLSFAPGAAPLTLKVRYRRWDLGSDSGAIQVVAGANGEEVSYVVSLHGEADAVRLHSDVYTQPIVPKADVLFVIDNSPSMANEQASIASNLAAYLQHVKATYVDFRFAVVSADAAAGAAFVTGPDHPDAVLTRSSPDLESQFAAKLDVGLSGSGTPMCLEQALAALTPSLVSGANAGFLRPNASLAVVCITDTTDHSPRAVADYVNDFWGIKAPNHKSMFSFNAVGGFTSSCPGDQGRLAAAVSQTNGTTADLCDPSWHQAFGTIYVGFPVTSTFFLTSAPDLSAGGLSVTVDGQPTPAQTPTGSTVWTYDSVANAVTFEPAFTPAEGSTVVISYAQSCR